jgi:hypothetical protein
MTTYQETFSELGQMVHGRLAKWLETNVAFLDETETDLKFAARHSNGYLIGISYSCQTETYVLYRLDDELQPLGLITITINAFMVMELFTKRRLVAALEVFN